MNGSRFRSSRFRAGALLALSLPCFAGAYGYLPLEVVEARSQLSPVAYLLGNLATFLVTDFAFAGLVSLGMAWWQRDLYGWCSRRGLHPRIRDWTQASRVGPDSPYGFLHGLGAVLIVSNWFEWVGLCGFGFAVALGCRNLSAWLLPRLAENPFGAGWTRTSPTPELRALCPEPAHQEQGWCETGFWTRDGRVRWMLLPGPQFPQALGDEADREAMLAGLKVVERLAEEEPQLPGPSGSWWSRLRKPETTLEASIPTERPLLRSRLEGWRKERNGTRSKGHGRSVDL